MIQERSLWKLILLSVVTCGIYSIYFWYQFDRDVNLICEGDGEQPMSYLLVVVLSVLTCSIFLWYWYYKKANRLQANARRYGMEIQENGTTVILWFLIGGWFFFVGIFVGYHILIKNINRLAEAYNHDVQPKEEVDFYSRPSDYRRMEDERYGDEQMQRSDARYPEEVFDIGYEKRSERTESFQTVNQMAPEEEIREEFQGEEEKGYLYGVTGEYAGVKLSIDDGKSVIIGRNPQECNLIVKGRQVSRKHCSVTYAPDQDRYLFVDYSSNGTYLSEDDSRLPSYRELVLRPGTTVYLGTREISFCLGGLGEKEGKDKQR